MTAIGTARGSSKSEQEQTPVTATRVSLGRVFRAESANYVLLVSVTIFMVGFGLVMVLSSSSVDSFLGNDNFFTKFIGQGVYALVGLPLMLVASRMPALFWKRTAIIVLGITTLAQLLVVTTPLGVGNDLNKNWLKIGSLSVQPSEGIKIGLALWLGVLMARKADRLNDWRHSVVPALVTAGLPVLLVLAGGDLGTALIMIAIILGALFFAGVRIRYLAATTVAGVVVAALVALSSPSRMGRILSFLGIAHESTGDQWQISNGFYALASGGVFGVGLGNSKSKWAWLPVADSDFIFAIIGEELGLIGAILVLCLFVLLAFAFLRIIHATDDPFERVTTAAIMVWIIGQALVNIAVVLGLLPTLGVPLPLISRGGTAMISTLVSIGIVLSFARGRKA